MVYITRSLQVYNSYANTWGKCRRLANPHLVKEMPTFEFVKNGKFSKISGLYVCGLGVTGSLGLPKFFNPRIKSNLSAKQVGSATFCRLRAFSTKDKIKDIACGYGYTLVAGEFQETSHSVLGFGINSHSQIGYQPSKSGQPLEIVINPSKIIVPTKSPIVKVACGRSHSILLNQSGQVFSLGCNSLGQCGRPIDEKEEYFGSKIIHCINELPPNIKELECGQDHSIFLTEHGEVFSCGWGADGQTGLGHFETESTPQRVKGDIEKVNVIKVSSYADTVLALDNDGNVFGWGNSEYSQFRTLVNDEAMQFNIPRHLRFRDIPGKIVDVACGGSNCAILNDLGQVYVWGFGILGKGPELDQSSRPSLIPESLFGTNLYNPDVKVVKIHASLSHFAAVNNLGDLYTWGKNRGGSLGFAHGHNQYFPMQVNINLACVKKVALGVDHTCVLAEKVC